MERKFKQPYTHRRFASRKDYTHVLGAAPLPDELLFLTPILNQNDTGPANDCTAYAAAAIRQAMTGKTYDPAGQWQLEEQYVGGSAPDGIKLKDQMEVGRNIGFAVPGQPLPADKAFAYFYPPDLTFEGIKQTINQVKAPLSAGLNWYTSFDTADGIVPHVATGLLGGHDVKIAGFTKKNGIEYLVVQNSWGTDFGDHGLFYFDKYATENYLTVFGAGYWSDDPNIPIARWGVLAALMQNLKALLEKLLNRKVGFPPPLLWDTTANARHSVRVICDEEGLSWNDKNILCACVEVESGFLVNPKPNENKSKSGDVWSTDWGIVQINDYWNIGPGKPFPSVDYVLANPEACVRWMARQWKAGNQHLWSSYTSGAYKKYL